MNRTISLLALGATLALAGCGIVKTAEDTRDEVRKSNDTQAQLVVLTTKLRELTEQLKGGIDKTNAAVHLQVLTVALQQLLAPENTESLTAPARMLPYAEVFATEARPDELVQIFYAFLSDALLNFNGTEDSTEKELRVMSRQISLVAGSAIAAFTPKDKMDAIIKSEIDGNGRYKGMMYTYLLCRYLFMRDFFLGGILEKTEVITLGALQKTVLYFEELKSIATLPYADNFKVKIPLVTPTPDPANPGRIKFKDLTQAVNKVEWKGIARKAKALFTAKLPPEVLSTPEAQALMKHFDL